ncbi:variant erythrocyte surface antigen-1 family protein, partial [Babesia divergens]
SSAQKVFSSSSEWKSFSYPEDLSSLFEKLCDYVRKIFVALNFLYFQCERNAGQGGWNDCAFGRQCVKALKSSSTSVSSASSSPCCSSSDPSNQGYLCTAINKDPVHDHCQKGSCRGFPGSSGKCSVHTQAKPGSTSSAPVKCTPCPHPLQRFLCHSKPNSDSESYPFGLSDITPMGFSKDNLPQKARHGRDLYHAIYGFCKDGYYPLTRLVQFILCVSRHPPETLGELFAFFVKFKDSGVFRNNFVQWIEGEPGFYSGEDLKNALEKLYGSHSGSHPSDLKSLHDCSSTKDFTCGKYLHALTEEAYNIFIDKFADTYLSYVCHLTKDFEKKLRDFYNDASTKFKTCCLTSCTKIVECPCALPFIYSHGFTFNSPSGLNCVNAQGQEHKNNEGNVKHIGDETNAGCTRKTCSQFLTQLDRVVNGQPFNDLLKEIEKFLWSIRKPFFLFVLSFWILVFAYFFYVHLYHLDILELNSHDHPAWSFKILPSTLFSDASSKLKDLSYFTL